MIRQRADALVALIERQRRINEQVRQLEGFRGQEQVVKQTLSRVIPVVKTCRVFRERGIDDASIDSSQLATLLLQLGQLKDRYQTDQASVLGQNRLTVLRSIEAYAGALSAKQLVAWGNYARRLVPTVNDDVLIVLSRIPALKIGIDSVWAGLRDLLARADRLPNSETEIDSFEAKASEARRRWEAFDDRHFSQQVLRFLKDAGTTGAALESYTDDVRQWLHEHHLTGSFRISSVSIARPGL